MCGTISTENTQLFPKHMKKFMKIEDMLGHKGSFRNSKASFLKKKIQTINAKSLEIKRR